MSPGHTHTTPVDPGEVRFEFYRSSGPGGQNVNKVSTAARLRFDVATSRSLTDEVKERLVRLAGSRVTAEGVLVIEAQRHRTQEQNRQDALKRLATLVERARRRPVVRKPTRPSAASRQRRLDAKKHKGAVKRQRRRPEPE